MSFSVSRDFGAPTDDVLSVLSQSGPLSAGRIGAITGLSRSEIRRALSRLVDARRVEVVPAARDGYPVQYRCVASGVAR